MIKEAVAFAAKAHEGTVRKGTAVPYIVHPLETAIIVSSMTNDKEMIVAALLHDVVEDTPVTGQEVEERFGERIASLVLAESEDKSKTWWERKQEKVAFIKTADRDIKILALGDKLSNLRSTARDYLLLGEEIWNRFNEKKKSSHAWYYWEMAEGLGELSEYPAYQEYVQLCGQVFPEYKKV
ncbi:HD domain-containing protein [Lachnospiraceae bacterium 62-35]